MKASTIGIDLAKNVFQLHGADRKGKKIFNKKVRRKDLLSTIKKLDDLHFTCSVTPLS